MTREVDLPRELEALARDLPLRVGRACSYGPPTGTGDGPPLPSDASRRACSRLGRMIAAGARVEALALWLVYGAHTGPDPDVGLVLALALLRSPEQARAHIVDGPRWGEGPSSALLTAEGAALLGRAIGIYLQCSEEPAEGGRIGSLVADADQAQGLVRTLRRDRAARDRREAERRLAAERAAQVKRRGTGT